MSPRSWVNNSGLALSADNLNAMEADIANAVPLWKANTFYTAGFRVIAPNGDVVSAKVDFTSGSTYSATNWNASTQDGRIGAVETKNTDQDARLNGRTLADQTDLHTITEQGDHRILYFTTDFMGQNMPTTTRGVVNVQNMGSNRILTYKTYETVPRIFMQTLVGGVWGVWKDLDAAAADNKARLDGRSLASNTDFHSVTEQGCHEVLWFPGDGYNAPFVGVRGYLHVVNLATSARILTFVTLETVPRMAIQTMVSSVWGAWREIGPAALDARVTTLEAKAPTPSSGFKTVPLQLTLGSASVSDAALTGTARYVMKYAAPLFRVRVNLQNIHPSSGAKRTGAVDFTGLWFGKHAGGGDFTAAPTQVQGAFSTPADGSKWTSKWFTLGQTPGVEDLLSFGYTAAAGTVSQCGGNGYTHADPTKADLTTVTGMAAAGSMPFYVWLEAETYATTPHIGVFGDSLSSGVGAGGVRYSMLTQYCAGKGALPTHYSNSGDTMQSWAGDLASYKWTVFDGLAKPDALIWAMGSNDLFADSITLTQAQGYFNTLYPQLQARVSQSIYLANITPRTAITGANETKRRDYNTWLTGLPLGARDLFNFRDAASDDDETLKAAYDSDGVHLNAAGYAAEAATITRPITTPPVTYQTI